MLLETQIMQVSVKQKGIVGVVHECFVRHPQQSFSGQGRIGSQPALEEKDWFGRDDHDLYTPNACVGTPDELTRSQDHLAGFRDDPSDPPR